jgi:dTDP-4-amino-4,6-dideoxygalactose transaminase
MNLDAGEVRARVTERTKAIIPVHLFGRPASLGELADLGIPIVEDAAQAFGARGAGTTGVVSTYSFYPTKNLFALGDGGLMTTSDEGLAERIRLLRFHGSKAKKDFELVGYNSRLDELQAAVLRLFLPHVEEWNRLRREAAGRYAELGLGEMCELPEDEPGHVYHVYVVRSPERDRIREHLAAAGIASSTYYETPLHRQPGLRRFGQADSAFPETERAARENLALPMWAGIGADVQERVVSAVREAVSLEAVR